MCRLILTGCEQSQPHILPLQTGFQDNLRICVKTCHSPLVLYLPMNSLSYSLFFLSCLTCCLFGARMSMGGIQPTRKKSVSMLKSLTRKMIDPHLVFLGKCKYKITRELAQRWSYGHKLLNGHWGQFHAILAVSKNWSSASFWLCWCLYGSKKCI